MRDFLATEVSEIKAKRQDTPRRSHRPGAESNSSPSEASPSKVRLKGLFQDGIWKCDCTPRLPSTRFQVRKEGKNHNRWFYTCQLSRDQGCGFFLWDDDAKSRERSAVMSNSRTEPHSSPIRPGGYPQEPLTPSKSRYIAGSGPSRSNTMAGNDYQWSPSDEELVTSFAKSSPTKKEATSLHTSFEIPNDPPETPRKVAKASPRASPGKRKVSFQDDDEKNGQYHTSYHQFGRPISPSPEGRRNTAVKPPQTIQRNAGGLFSPTETPSGAARFRSALSTPTKPTLGPMSPSKTPGGSSLFISLTEDVLGALQLHGIDLTEEASGALRDVCTRHIRLAQGVERGREVSRQAIKDREKEIKRLNEQNKCLEAELEVEKRLRRSEAGQDDGGTNANRTSTMRQEARDWSEKGSSIDSADDDGDYRYR